ncbi:endonuclease/exonuclease/phosphatase family protein [Sediminitomix flava]|uniref:Endonuclease/exonuclease/phosphatase family metal-dependent hydrolase n=1 Tax=Sediminitomix flava TaxID=379075 RepID=A0A315ZEI2_SEDFL|nr:endonuclease/exonuclease/phosphatase family protein [Sediminitomix flava]PWJ43742.1 endonuclease/exonuclease/phosphatase family metal-dependent hydrolase [Sediminitomix flava]
MKSILRYALPILLLAFIIWDKLFPDLNEFGIALNYIMPFLSFSLLPYIFYFVLKRKWKTVFLALLTVILSIPFLQGVFSWTLFSENNPDFIKVLSYNTRVFNIYKHLSGNEDENIKGALSFGIEHPAQIKCFQEYFNAKDAEREYLRITKAFEDSSYFSHTHAFLKNHVDHEFGLAIFSKFEIVDRGIVPISSSRQTNGAIYADIKIRDNKVRVYNIHLESLGEKFPSKLLEPKVFIAFWQSFTDRYQKRVIQIQEIVDHVQNSPYPVILCGDLNDVPHAYSGRLLNQNLSSSFEKKGQGFGFTLNKDNLLFFRIDQQFFSEGLKIHDFKTLNHIKWSDHFPIEAEYSFK